MRTCRHQGWPRVTPSSAGRVRLARGPEGATVPVAGMPRPGSAQAIAQGAPGRTGDGARTSTTASCRSGIARVALERDGGQPNGAYGIPQAKPGNKMAPPVPDWQTNATTQITWGLGYIKGRYGNPVARGRTRRRPAGTDLAALWQLPLRRLCRPLKLRGMEWALFGVVAIVSIVGRGGVRQQARSRCSTASDRARVGFSFIPGAPTDVPPEIILAGLLPPHPVFGRGQRSGHGFPAQLLQYLRPERAAGPGHRLRRRAACSNILFPKLSLAEGDCARRGHQPDGCRGRDRHRQEARSAAQAGHHPRGRGPRQRRDRARAAALRHCRSRVRRYSFWGALGTSSMPCSSRSVVGFVVGIVTVFIAVEVPRLDPRHRHLVRGSVPRLHPGRGRSRQRGDRCRGCRTLFRSRRGEAVHAAGSNSRAPQLAHPAVRARERRLPAHGAGDLEAGRECAGKRRRATSRASSGRFCSRCSMTAVLIVLRVVSLPLLLLVRAGSRRGRNAQQSRFRERLDRLIAHGNAARHGTEDARARPREAITPARERPRAGEGGRVRMARRRRAQLVRDARGRDARCRPVPAAHLPLPGPAHPHRLHGRGRHAAAPGRHTAAGHPADRIQGNDGSPTDDRSPRLLEEIDARTGSGCSTTRNSNLPDGATISTDVVDGCAKIRCSVAESDVGACGPRRRR